MAFRTRRQRRYTILRNSGFLRFEANELSKVPFKTPYMRVFIRNRMKEYEDAIKRDVRVGQWEKYIKDRYKENHYTRRLRSGKVVYNPWDIIKDYEFRYKAKHPEYESPWVNKKRRFRKATAKIEATITEQKKRWIKELDGQMKTAQGERLEQLKIQRENLQKGLDL